MVPESQVAHPSKILTLCHCCFIILVELKQPVIVKVKILHFERANLKIVLAAHKPSDIKQLINLTLHNLGRFTHKQNYSRPFRRVHVLDFNVVEEFVLFLQVKLHLFQLFMLLLNTH